MAQTILNSWVCVRCLRQASKNRRGLATAAAQVQLAAAQLSVASTHHDDKNLRAVFDNPSTWRTFSESRSKSQQLRGRKFGLLGNRHLKTPDGFEHFAQITLSKCRTLVNKVLAVDTVQGFKSLIKDLDRLSDLLCRVIDLADFVRVTHPDPAFGQAAARAHMIMFEYMNTLNTTTGLYDQLDKAIDNPDVVAVWSEEELTVAKILKKDFEQSAINLPPAARERFVTLSSKISALGTAFVEEMHPAELRVSIPSDALKGVDRHLVKSYSQRWGSASVPVMSSLAGGIIRTSQHEEARRKLYVANRKASQHSIDLLEEYLTSRSELASLSGFSSYSSMTLTDKMAKSPESVVEFLDALSAANSPGMRKRLRDIALRKEGKPQSWDLDLYPSRRTISAISPQIPESLREFFSLGTVIQGLSRLFQRLYGVRLEPRETGVGETWTSDVRRLDVISEDEGLIAVVYCDLFRRAGKSPNPAHFTLRCSRLIPEDEIRESNETYAGEDDHLGPESLANDGMAIRRSVEGQIYQLPTIALICDFAAPSTKTHTPPLLSPQSLSTLFHEMGHAIHSILGRTKLQNVSGTRCATDFAELPSVLMERFAVNPDVLALYARHWETDKPLPPSMAQDLQKCMSASEGATETESQILLARLDQSLHGEHVGGSPGWSDVLTRQIWRKHSSLEEPRETRWQGLFGHLVGYGSTYYAYLFDRAIAGRVWKQTFKNGKDGGAVDREAGERYAEEVLKWGGSRNPWTNVGMLMGGDEGQILVEGGKKAMEIVGKWGVDKA